MSEITVIDVVGINTVKPYENNPRHNDRAIKKVADSIQAYGFRQPIVVDKDMVIIAGHTRWKAAKQLGYTTVPVVIAKDLTEEQARAYRIADNRVAQEAIWNNSLLADELNLLKDVDFDLSLTGFNDDELQQVLENSGFTGGLSDEDEQTEPTEGIEVAAEGDVFILGKHRLMCGDSTNPQHVTKLYNGLSPALMVTDPPYGVQYDPSWRDGADLGIGERSKGKVLNDDKVDWSAAYSLFTGYIAYVWHAGRYTAEVAKNLTDLNYQIISQIVWAKQHFVLSRGDYHWQHEPCWYAVKKGCKHNWQGARDQSTLWEIKNNNSFGNRDKEETVGHGTQKPVECMARPIANNSIVGDWVYDPFGGVGTTLIACEKLSRRCLMMELNPRYVDATVRRWQKFTGKKAILESNGKFFDELNETL